MELAELDVLLDELEIRLERLRALYEQYFLGIEKIEPTIARKDVDRRIYVLRREKIRNTAKRFKLQTIIQRYNTFQQYWQRICREIENGTYRRHVLKAERTVGKELLTIAARKRLGRAGRGEEPAADEEASTPPPAAPSEPAEPSRIEPAPALAAAAATSPAPAAPPAAAAPSPPSSPPPPKPAAPPEPPARKPAARPQRPAQQFESLDLDMDFLGDWDPAKVKQPPKPKPSVPPQRQSVVPPPARAASIAPTPPKAAAPAPAPAAPPPPPLRAAAAPPPAPLRAAVPPPPPAPSPAAASSEPSANAARAASAAAAQQRAAEARPRLPLPARDEPPAPKAANLSEDRIKELHQRLNHLKRENHEAGQVSLEGLAKSLRATEEKLRQQHKGRNVDFDVVVKDGKTVVKPIIR